ncbi:MAG: TMEM165/GDT1 family protein [Clostridium sp.]|jgi:putative Ca2+/H+ antiporter (TMEM165/GDT1 family)|uniref:TMEM165/GDT1 family protein n=1 Tax=Clostridium sp. TaxID=1506 RepID=UPI0025BA1FA7|nr:TMEM165/GDT1 family protein [Clostridium sp.]MCH3965216.1 TMEM165/GDT1 family protein [Clostridium sp.]MCI1714436.1 TMEM165/GDT1 family protein [Clostridium sp.]MCI1798698.1 TMEM165/GDT1 family protein [Clostridium sp.]MCI1812571.1 TMEM165/GDT1 family protein [Clostridium sp.]MCI1869508.1 TMEM165/GDT1 family protein [Clostridium sp.]
MTVIIKALLLVVAAEMGDKTQLLAMAMASKYRIKQVLTGVFVATILNHALAVAVGNYLSYMIPMDTVKIAAGAAFLGFGFWTLRGDKIDEDGKKKSKFGPVITVATAFFLAEMGDKTQLMTITISAQSSQPLLVLMGSTIGMLIADGIGILGGAWMCRHIPEMYIKWAAGIIFIFFGTITIYNAVPLWMINTFYITIYIISVAVLAYLFGIKFSNLGQACTMPRKNNTR